MKTYNEVIAGDMDGILAHRPCSEGNGIHLNDASGNGYNGLATGVLADIWANKQDEYHYNLLKGHSGGAYLN